MNLGNVQGTFFVIYTGADYNRLWNYKIKIFTIFVRGDGEGGWKGGRLRFSFECLRRGRGLPKSNKFEQGGGESKFWSFCDNVAIECLLRWSVLQKE